MAICGELGDVRGEYLLAVEANDDITGPCLPRTWTRRPGILAKQKSQLPRRIGINPLIFMPMNI